MRKAIIVTLVVLLLPSITACIVSETDNDPSESMTYETDEIIVPTTIQTESSQPTTGEALESTAQLTSDTTITKTIVRQTTATRVTQKPTTSLQTTQPSALSAEQEEQIKRDWIVYRATKLGLHKNVEGIEIDEIQITQYLGTYNGSIAIMIRDDYMGGAVAVVKPIEVAGYWFDFYTTLRFLHIWNNGNFLPLTGAYQQGLITSQDVRNIQKAL